MRVYVWLKNPEAESYESANDIPDVGHLGESPVWTIAELTEFLRSPAGHKIGLKNEATLVGTEQGSRVMVFEVA